jgi:predicted glycogen debranching enzyme
VSQFDQSICGNLQIASRREWLETNGIGGFASSTIIGLNTRRYHGLLVAATKPPLGRMVLLSKLEETLILDERRLELSCNRYPGVVHPQGYRYLLQFRQDPFPIFVYAGEGWELEKSLFLIHGENTAVIQYSLRHPGGRNTPLQHAVLELRPLIAFRDYHQTTHENGVLDRTLGIEPGQVRCSPYPGCPDLYFLHTAGKVRSEGYWYRNVEYEIEQERGLDFREDLFNPLLLTIDLTETPDVAVIASTAPGMAPPALPTIVKFRATEVQRRQALEDSVPVKDPLVQSLVQAADQFLVRRGNETTVIAGYHWFSDWGRDTMISLPGLTLVTRRFDAARSILRTFARVVDRGMLPNRFPDSGEQPEYNTVDASLWFFEAIRALAAYAGDYEFIRRELYPALGDIITWHERGTRFGIRVDGDGLLHAGEPGVALTWMDAQIGGNPVTPRHGKPVEIQALWYNALRVALDLANHFNYSNDTKHYKQLADRVQSSFEGLFWNEAAQCLYDVVGSDERDPAIRPNQIFAVSLFHTLLTPEKAKAVVAAVGRHLLTPFGLRTLAPLDPRYHGRYDGDPTTRDAAYHQGTVWPWLMGPYITAFLKVNEGSPEARTEAARMIGELRDYLEGPGLGQIPEVFDADAPERAGGCLAQAWSVAELLRSRLEDFPNAPSRVVWG